MIYYIRKVKLASSTVSILLHSQFNHKKVVSTALILLFYEEKYISIISPARDGAKTGPSGITSYC